MAARTAVIEMSIRQEKANLSQERFMSGTSQTIQKLCATRTACVEPSIVGTPELNF